MSELARGGYRYWRNGALQPVTEPWSLHRQSDGTLRLQGQRRIDGVPVLDVEADYTGARCTRLQLRWQAPASAMVRTAHYRLDGAGLHWRFGAGDSLETLALPDGALLFPLLRAATGPLLGQLGTEPRNVVLPDLRDPADAEAFLRPLLSERQVRIDGADDDGLHRLRYVGGEYGEAGADCALGPEGLLRHYRWDSPQGVWEVRLEDAWWQPEFRDFAPAP